MISNKEASGMSVVAAAHHIHERDRPNVTLA
jgi:hypothetical protein